MPRDALRRVAHRIAGTAEFRRFHLGRNGAAHGGSVAQLFDGLLGYAAFTLSRSRAQRTSTGAASSIRCRPSRRLR